MPIHNNQGRAVPASFQLPWNTTRSMADVWADWAARRDEVALKPPAKMGRPPGRITSQKFAYAGRE